MELAINTYNDWVKHDDIWKSWIHEDYPDVTVYEHRNADIICVQRDINGKIIDAWIE